MDDDANTSNKRVRDEIRGKGRCFEARFMRSIIPRSYQIKNTGDVSLFLILAVIIFSQKLVESIAIPSSTLHSGILFRALCLYHSLTISHDHMATARTPLRVLDR